MSDDSPWMDKPTFMAHVKRSERTVQLMVKDGRVERRIGEDKRAYYRMAPPQRDVTVLRDAAPPDWAVELLAEMRALRTEMEAQRAATPQIEARSESQPRNDSQREGFWARLFGRGK